MSSWRLSVLAGVLAAGVGLVWGAARLEAGPEDEPGKSAAGPTYSNDGFGVTTSGPEGWKLIEDKVAAVSVWQRLATFNDTKTDAQVVLYSRPRSASNLDALMASVRKEWDKSGDRLRVDGMRKLDASALNPIARVIVDGSFTRKAAPKKGKDGVPAPPGESTPMRVQATYYVGPGYEFLLYAQAQQTHWSRLHRQIEAMRDQLKFNKQVDSGPTGEGSYRNEKIGFTCRYPKDYAVVQPAREHHVVKFAGVSANDPDLSVYAFPYEEEASDDAQRLVAYYEGEKGGTAQRSRTEVSGTESVQVTARAMIDGVDQAIWIAVIKRGDTCYRLRCVVPTERESTGASAFRTFLASFRFGS
ncbi:MAG: hypothetical protein O2894_07945 [Planctomycetota bacterium]|nr:hypothetical protein [Planctomycetota bacterium]